MKVKIKKVPHTQNGLSIENNQVKPLSQDTFMLTGPSHAQGGIDLSYMGNQVEAEGGEPISINNNGDLVVFGNMRIPNSKTKFKSAAKQIGKDEASATKQSEKANNLVADNDPYNKYQSLSFNSGLVIQDAANQKLDAANKQKELLGSIQQRMLDISNQQGIDPKDWEKMMNGGKVKRKAQSGISLFNPPPIVNPLDKFYANRPVVQPQPVAPVYDSKNPQDYVRQSLINAANQRGVDADLLQRLAFQESGFRPGAKGINTKYGTAYGHVQFLPSTAKEYGITEAQLKSKKPEDIDKVSMAAATHLQRLIGKYDGDRALALAEYNGGEGAIKDVQKGLGKKDITGQDAIDYWAAQNEKNPSNNPNLYRNQTLNYVNNILNTPDDEFYGDTGSGNSFRQNYYNGAEGTTPPVVGEMTPYQFEQYRRNDTFTPIDVMNTPVPLQTPKPVGQPISREQFNSVTTTQQRNKRIPSLADRNRLNPLDFLPEIGAILDRPDYVQGQQYNPSLLQNYNVSFQDRVNQNQSTFNALSRNFTNNPEALAVLAGQNYSANNQVLADEFRTNQGNFNQTMNQNTQILNDAQLRNIQLRDDQYNKQAAAQANTEANRNGALTSISNKYAQNRAENNNIKLLENMFRYRPDQNLQLQNYNTANFSPTVNTNTPSTPQDAAYQTQLAKTQKAQYDMQAAQARAEKASKKSALDFLKIFR